MIIEKLLLKSNLEVADFFDAFEAEVFAFDELLPFIEEVVAKEILIDFNEMNPNGQNLVLDAEDRLKVVSKEKYEFEQNLKNLMLDYESRVRDSRAKEWMTRRVPVVLIESNLERKVEVDHIVDFFNSGYSQEIDVFEKLLSMDFFAVKEKSEQWNRQMMKNKNIREEDSEFVHKVYSFGAYDFYELNSLQALDRESDMMGHCVGKGSYDQNLVTNLIKIYSLRSSKSGESHATVELELGVIRQIQGRGNAQVVEKYHEALRSFVLEYLQINLNNLSSHDAASIGIKGISVYKGKFWHYPPGHEVLDHTVLYQIRNADNIEQFKGYILAKTKTWSEEAFVELYALIKNKDVGFSVGQFAELKLKVDNIIANFKELYQEINIGVKLEGETSEELNKNIKAYLLHVDHPAIRQQRKAQGHSLKLYYSFLTNLNAMVRVIKDEDLVNKLLEEDQKNFKIPQIKYETRDLKRLVEEVEALNKQIGKLDYSAIHTLLKNRIGSLDSPGSCEECSNESSFNEQEKIKSDVESRISDLDVVKDCEELGEYISGRLNSVAEYVIILTDKVQSLRDLAVCGNHKNLNIESFIQEEIKELGVNEWVSSINKTGLPMSRVGWMSKIPVSDSCFAEVNSALKDLEKLQEQWDRISSDKCGECDGQDEIDENAKEISLGIDEDWHLPSGLLDEYRDILQHLENFISDLGGELEYIFADAIEDYKDF